VTCYSCCTWKRLSES